MTITMIKDEFQLLTTEELSKLKDILDSDDEIVEVKVVFCTKNYKYVKKSKKAL